MKTAVVLGWAMVAGCGRLVSGQASLSDRPASSLPASPAATSRSPQPSDAGHGLPFIEDDYPRALAEARARHLPLFVDAWATWCHTCLSVRSYVFPDPALRPLADRFVWLSLDTERAENAAAVSRLGVRVLPTLYVIDPATEDTLLAWPGSLTAPELSLLLESAAAGAQAVDDCAGATGLEAGAGGAVATDRCHGNDLRVPGRAGEAQAAADLLRGHRARAEGRPRDAASLYRRALDASPPGWSRRPETVDALVTSLSEARDFPPCAARAAAEAEHLAGTFQADVLRTGIGCAEELPEGTVRRSSLAPLAAAGERAASDAGDPILADDRSDLFDSVVDALRSLGRAGDVTRVAGSWIAFLEAEAARAPSPAGRAVFDAHRLLASQALGDPGRAVPALEQSEREFPGDYNPPARLAIAYLALGRMDDALAAVKRALERAYGPRKLRLWSTEADVHEARGDVAGARAALETALAFARTTPLTPGYERMRDAIAARLAKLEGDR